jgi:hypothetical protein
MTNLGSLEQDQSGKIIFVLSVSTWACFIVAQLLIKNFVFPKK